MKFCIFACFCLILLSTVLCQREYRARRVARQCVREAKVTYEVARKFSKGDFSDDTEPAKCFLKCFAYRIGFFNTTGHFQREELLKYVHYVVPDTLPATEVVDDCKANTIYDGDNLCDYVFQAYKCFWDYVNTHTNSTTSTIDEPKSIPFSLYNKLGFELLEKEEASE